MRLRALVMALALTAALVPATTVATGGTYWNVAGTYGISVGYSGSNYPETLVLTQSGVGTITGTSLGQPCTPSCADFTITSGSVVGNTITMVATSPFTLTLTGAIAADGSMAGTWADGLGGMDRTGTWSTTSGAATFLDASPHAQSDLVRTGTTGPAVGGVIFNSSAGTSNNFEMTLMLKKVSANTTYDVYLFLDQSGTSLTGFGNPLATFTTNGVGNGTVHVNTAIPTGVHTVGVDVVLHSDAGGSDLYVTPGLYGLNLFMYFQ